MPGRDVVDDASDRLDSIADEICPSVLMSDYAADPNDRFVSPAPPPTLFRLRRVAMDAPTPEAAPDPPATRTAEVFDSAAGMTGDATDRRAEFQPEVRDRREIDDRPDAHYRPEYHHPSGQGSDEPNANSDATDGLVPDGRQNDTAVEAPRVAPSEAGPHESSAIWQTLVQNRVVILVGVLVASAAYFTGQHGGKTDDRLRDASFVQQDTRDATAPRSPRTTESTTFADSTSYPSPDPVTETMVTDAVPPPTEFEIEQDLFGEAFDLSKLKTKISPVLSPPIADVPTPPVAPVQVNDIFEAIAGRPGFATVSTTTRSSGKPSLESENSGTDSGNRRPRHLRSATPAAIPDWSVYLPQ